MPEMTGGEMHGHGHGNGTHGHHENHGNHTHEHHEESPPEDMEKWMKLTEKCGPLCAPMVDNLARSCEVECDGIMEGKKVPAWCRTDCVACAKCWGMVLPPVAGKKVVA